MTHIRRAQPQEADALTDIARRSKAYWGYDEAFMEACGASLTVTEAMIRDAAVYVADSPDAEISGFYIVTGPDDHVCDIDMLFVSPDWIGKGIGGSLWQHAYETAKRFNAKSLTVQSDPHARAFYERMGMHYIDDSPSSCAPRNLPILEIAIS